MLPPSASVHGRPPILTLPTSFKRKFRISAGTIKVTADKVGPWYCSYNTQGALARGWSAVAAALHLQAGQRLYVAAVGRKHLHISLAQPDSTPLQPECTQSQAAGPARRDYFSGSPGGASACRGNKSSRVEQTQPVPVSSCLPGNDPTDVANRTASTAGEQTHGEHAAAANDAEHPSFVKVGCTNTITMLSRSAVRNTVWLHHWHQMSC